MPNGESSAPTALSDYTVSFILKNWKDRKFANHDEVVKITYQLGF